MNLGRKRMTILGIPFVFQLGFSDRISWVLRVGFAVRLHGYDYSSYSNIQGNPITNRYHSTVS